MSDLMHTPNAGAVPDASDGALPTHTDAERESARKRLEARQGLSADAVSYVESGRAVGKVVVRVAK